MTTKEEKEGVIRGQRYRLPTDEEWSQAANLAESGDAPWRRDGRLRGAFIWGNSWPPPVFAGNFDESLSLDGFPTTSPVATFPPNKLGIYDLAGNVAEWCLDSYTGESKEKVIRGGSFQARMPSELLASTRRAIDEGAWPEDVGFRVVLERTGRLP